MSLISEIKHQGVLDSVQLIKLFDEVANNGHVLIVKSDGPRDSQRFTSIISFPSDPTKAIRRDGDDLLQTVGDALKGKKTADDFDSSTRGLINATRGEISTTALTR